LHLDGDTLKDDQRMEKCIACSLTDGTLDLPGGRIFSTQHWVVEHTIGPLGVGTLIVKPFRHCTHVWELTNDETLELGPLLKQVSSTIQAILKPDQIYVCLWSHAGWEPGHIHFVLQPAWNDSQRTHAHPGPSLQMDMFNAGVKPARQEVEAFATRAREVIGKIVDESAA
jgi:diadenosine tetraphosphate (Ap4A) HIT family hydrolase